MEWLWKLVVSGLASGPHEGRPSWEPLSLGFLTALEETAVSLLFRILGAHSGADTQLTLGKWLRM